MLSGYFYSHYNFNPRSPHGERLNPFPPSFPHGLFQSTLPARGATQEAFDAYKQQVISIHAPRTGSDAAATRRNHFRRYFNPRSPHGERPDVVPTEDEEQDFNPRSPHGERRDAVARLDDDEKFQSTLPARGATLPPWKRHESRRNFNPRSPHGERLLWHYRSPHRLGFQSTLPARGATRHCIPSASTRRRFQSTLPARGATSQRRTAALYCGISIHAPRTGSDQLT